MVTRNANQCFNWDFSSGTCPEPASNYPDGAPGIVNQFYPEAVFKQDQVIVNVNARIKPTFSVFGFYNWTRAKSDGGAESTASNAYNLSQDYGRASFASTNMVFLMANYTAPYGIRVNPFLIAQSGKPYNIVTNTISPATTSLTTGQRSQTVPCATRSQHAMHLRPSDVWM